MQTHKLVDWFMASEFVIHVLRQKKSVQHAPLERLNTLQIRAPG